MASSGYEAKSVLASNISCNSLDIGNATATKTTVATLNPADIIALTPTSGFLIVPPPGPGFGLFPTGITYAFRFGTAAFVAGAGPAADLSVNWGPLSVGFSPQLFPATSAVLTTQGSNFEQVALNTGTPRLSNAVDNQGLYVTTASGSNPYSGGAGSSLTVAITYSIIPV